MSATFVAELGLPEQALAEAGPLAERLQAAGDVHFTEPRSLQLRLLAECGAHDHAPPADQLVAAARESGEAQACAVAFAAATRLLLAQAWPDQALALLSELEQVAGIRADPYYASALPRLMRTTLALEDRELGTRLTDGVEPRTPLAEHALTACRAQLAEATDAHADAPASMRRRPCAGASSGNVPERAYALLGQGRCLAARVSRRRRRRCARRRGCSHRWATTPPWRTPRRCSTKAKPPPGRDERVALGAT